MGSVKGTAVSSGGLYSSRRRWGGFAGQTAGGYRRSKAIWARDAGPGRSGTAYGGSWRPIWEKSRREAVPVGNSHELSGGPTRWRSGVTWAA